MPVSDINRLDKVVRFGVPWDAQKQCQSWWVLGWTYLALQFPELSGPGQATYLYQCNWPLYQSKKVADRWHKPLCWDNFTQSNVKLPPKESRVKSYYCRQYVSTVYLLFKVNMLGLEDREGSCGGGRVVVMISKENLIQQMYQVAKLV